MAERPIWRGHLRLALVSCPVALHAAISGRESLHFHFINPDTGNRVRMVSQDAETGDELSRRDLARGYEFKKDNYLLLTDDDFEAARIESSSTITIDKFVPADAIDPVYYDASYYLVPDGDAGRDVYVVLAAAIARSRRVALSRVVMARRERAIAIMPMGRGLVAHTLNDAKDLRDAGSYFTGLSSEKPDAEMVKLATQLIDRQTGQFDPADMEDRYETRLREVIDAKLRGEGIEPEAESEDDRSNVVDLMAALKRSLGGDTGPAAAKPKHSLAPKAGPPKGAPAPKPPPPRKPARKRA
jgi:DNA end-binding protein Ku